jgi:hypothetical protein
VPLEQMLAEEPTGATAEPAATQEPAAEDTTTPPAS